MKTRLLIIGGVAGGATAAARARRLNEHAEIILFERGGYISFAVDKKLLFDSESSIKSSSNGFAPGLRVNNNILFH